MSWPAPTGTPWPTAFSYYVWKRENAQLPPGLKRDQRTFLKNQEYLPPGLRSV